MFDRVGSFQCNKSLKTLNFLMSFLLKNNHCNEQIIKKYMKIADVQPYARTVPGLSLLCQSEYSYLFQAIKEKNNNIGTNRIESN